MNKKKAPVVLDATMNDKERAPRNRTISLSHDDRRRYQKRLLTLNRPAAVSDILNRTICQDVLDAQTLLPDNFVDLLVVDPPYNLNKVYNQREFRKTSMEEYIHWLDGWIAGLVHTLKDTASIYICSDWRSSAAVQLVASKYFILRNRITWEREKGRGAKQNWKNCSEDVWFCTVSDNYTFNLDAVKLRRKVLAPYTERNGQPKDWSKTDNGNYRLTHPSNLWTDITVPFWSMPENTDHPTQKPEKLVAKIILASSNEHEVVLDPFLGSGTTSVVAKKLHRDFVGIEIDETYCCLTEKRLHLADSCSSIQGYHDDVFWERNTLREQLRSVEEKVPTTRRKEQPRLFQDD